MKQLRSTVNSIREKLPSNFLAAAAVILYPFCCYLLMEFCHPRAPWSFYFEYVSSRLRFFALAWVVFSLLMAVITLLTQRVWVAAAAVSVIFASATYANYHKLANWNVPVQPSDLSNIFTGIKAAGLISAYPTKRMLLAWAVMAAAVLLLWLIKVSWPRRWRVIIALILVAALILYFASAFCNKERRVALGIDSSLCNTRAELYYRISFFPAFFSLVDEQLISPPEPEGYSDPGTISGISGEISAYSDAGSTPDIVVVLLETYHDMTRFGVEFSEDITKNYDAVAEEGYSGNVISALYGGGTANAEFEVLSGLATGNAYITTMAYNDYVYDGMPSIVSHAKELGYRTLAMHSYNDELFNRPLAYADLGFDSVMFDRDYDVEPQYMREYFSDVTSMQQLEETYSRMAAESDEPIFINMVTMQNHGPYDNDYEEIKAQGYKMVEPIDSGLSPEADKALAAMATLQKHTDDAIGYIVDYFRTVDRDVLLVFYGDHQTAFSDEVESLGGYGEGLSAEVYKATTPYLEWANYESGSGTFGDLSLNALLPHALDAYGVSMPKHFGWMLDECREGDVKCVSRNMVLLNDGDYAYSDAYADELDDYYVVLYDIICEKNRLGIY